MCARACARARATTIQSPARDDGVRFRFERTRARARDAPSRSRRRRGAGASDARVDAGDGDEVYGAATVRVWVSARARGIAVEGDREAGRGARDRR
jgi:hypothetical protein